MVRRARILVSGRVQGVFYRANTKRIAKDLGLLGYVRNLPDRRSVEIVAEGDEKKISELIEWAKKGPVFAKVEKLQTELSDATNEFVSFDVRRD